MNEPRQRRFAGIELSSSEARNLQSEFGLNTEIPVETCEDRLLLRMESLAAQR